MLKNILRKIVYREKADSQAYVNHLKNLGCMIGEECIIYVPTKTYIDTTRPYLINIGDHVKITQGVTVLTHGYDFCVLQDVYGDVLGSAGEVSIGDHVFIGMNSLILKGVHIGNNVIIGAGSLVNKDVPDNSVVGGVPAKVLCTLEEYYTKRRESQPEEAYTIYRCYRKRWNTKAIPMTCFHEFFWMFENEMNEGKIENALYNSMMNEKSYIKYFSTKRQFTSYESFLKTCSERYEREEEK